MAPLTVETIFRVLMFCVIEMLTRLLIGKSPNVSFVLKDSLLTLFEVSINMSPVAYVFFDHQDVCLISIHAPFLHSPYLSRLPWQVSYYELLRFPAI